MLTAGRDIATTLQLPQATSRGHGEEPGRLGVCAGNDGVGLSPLKAVLAAEGEWCGGRGCQ